MKSAFSRFAVLLAFVLAFAVVMAWAQAGAGDLTGIVYDPTGAVVPNAKITVLNAATGVTRATVSTSAGVYRFSALPVATYTMTVEAPGFRKSEVKGIVISVGTTISQDVHLEVGAAVETVTVEAGAGELIQTTSSTVSALVDQTVWKEMPLEFRDQNVFINLLPGVVPDDFAGSTRGAAVSGARGGSGNFMVEGYDNNDQGQGGRGALISGAITSISPEAIQEYRVLQHNYSAEYGKGGGFVTDTVLKSGTNDIHGSAFYYGRWQKLAANSFFSNKFGDQDARVRNQFGASLGGPLIKDRTFLYGSFEGHLFRETTPLGTGRALTQDFIDFVQSGAFATFAESDPNGICNNASIFGGGAAPCPGAFATSSALGPVFQALDNPLFKRGDVTQNPSFVSTGLASFFGDITYPVPIFADASSLDKSGQNTNRVSLKLDHAATDKDQFSGMFLFEDSDANDSDGGSDNGFGAPISSVGRSVNIGVTYTRTFSPTILNQARAAFLHHTRDFPELLGNTPSVLTAFDELNWAFGQTSGLPQFFTDNQYQMKDDLSIVHGNHNFKLGGEYRRITNGSAFEAEKNALMWPNDVENLLTDGAFGESFDNVAFGGTAYGSFYLMEASVDPTRPGQYPEYYRGYRANEFAGYIQDEWRVTPRLTLNVGVRYEYFGVPHNFRPGIDSNFYFGTAVTPIPATSNVFFPANSALAAKVYTGEFQQRDHGIWNKDTNNFAPRFGFAWDVFGDKRLAIRGGGGVFYDRLWNNLFENIRFNAPFFCFCGFGALYNGVAATYSQGIYTNNFTDPSPFTDPVLLPNLPVPSPRHMDQDLVTAYWEQYFVGMEYRLPGDMALEVDYVNTLGRKLTGVIDINTFNGRSEADARSMGSSARINTSIGGDNFRTNAFSSNYNGLQTSLRKRFSNGIQFQVNYTWSHALDMLSDAFNNRGGLRPTDNYDLAVDYGNADFDIRHRFVTSVYYEPPLWKDNPVLGGWGFSGIFTAQTGRPQTLYNSGLNCNADGYTTDRCMVYTGGGNINDHISSGSPADEYVSPTLFRPMAGDGSDCLDGVVISATQWWCNGQFGRNVLVGPGFVNVDLGIHKRFKLTEQLGLKFEANFFNLFNHPNFFMAISRGNLNSGAFGAADQTFDPRIIQLALRLDW